RVLAAGRLVVAREGAELALRPGESQPRVAAHAARALERGQQAAVVTGEGTHLGPSIAATSLLPARHQLFTLRSGAVTRLQRGLPPASITRQGGRNDTYSEDSCARVPAARTARQAGGPGHRRVRRPHPAGR